MHAPDHSALLLGVADVLRDSVLVELDDGVARRQLKAALHIVERVGRSVHLTPGYLVADIDDVLGTLAGAGLSEPGLVRELEAARTDRERVQEQGWSTPFEEIAVLHGRAQALLVSVARALPTGGAADELPGLYRRMLAREAAALGLRDAAPPSSRTDDRRTSDG